MRALLIPVLVLNVSSPTAGFSAIEKRNKTGSAVPAGSKARSRFVSANGIRIHYLEWGRGASTIILLHGLYDSSDAWAAIAPLLARHYRVIAPDRRGAGLTDKPSTGYDYHTLARDVGSLIVALKLRHVNVVGHSAGAGVAMTLAVADPEKIRTLVLVDGGFWPKRERVSAALKVQQCEDEAAACRRREAMELAGNEYEAEELYARVSPPVLLVMGIPVEEEAKKFAVEISEARQHVENVAKEKLKTGHVAVIEGTSHWIQRDRPKELARVIEQFLKRGGAGRVGSRGGQLNVLSRDQASPSGGNPSRGKGSLRKKRPGVGRFRPLTQAVVPRISRLVPWCCLAG